MFVLRKLTSAERFRPFYQRCQQSDVSSHAMTVQSTLRLPHFTTAEETSSSIVLLHIRVFYKLRRDILYEELLYALQKTFISSYLHHFSILQSSNPARDILHHASRIQDAKARQKIRP